jgi:hypothetical protein
MLFKLASGNAPLRKKAFAMVIDILEFSRESEKSLGHIVTKLLQCSGVNMHIKWHSHPNYHLNTNWNFCYKYKFLQSL